MIAAALAVLFDSPGYRARLAAEKSYADQMRAYHEYAAEEMRKAESAPMTDAEFRPVLLLEGPK